MFFLVLSLFLSLPWAQYIVLRVNPQQTKTGSFFDMDIVDSNFCHTDDYN